MMRFKIDENLPIEARDAFIQAGFEASTVEDEALSGSPDANIASICRAEKRAIVTLDLDFADIRAYPPAEYSGLIVLRLQKQDKRTVLNIVERLVPLLQDEPLVSRLWIVDERRVRIRE